MRSVVQHLDRPPGGATGAMQRSGSGVVQILTHEETLFETRIRTKRATGVVARRSANLYQMCLNPLLSCDAEYAPEFGDKVT